MFPKFGDPDDGDGGVRRVVEGQQESLLALGYEFVAMPDDADVIASHIVIPEPYVRRFPDAPMVAHCHGLYWHEYSTEQGSMWPAWALKANEDVMEAIRIADIVTAPSEWVAQSIRRATARDVRVVPHGVNAHEWTHRTDHGGYVLWNKNRADPVCDPAPVAEVAALLPDVYFRSTFGQGAANVLVTGKQPFTEARESVERAAVYLATTRETFGVGTLEAFAAGVPVVGWWWGTNADLIDHGVDGWLCAPGDYEGLAEGIRWAIANREQLAPACRAKAEQYPWSRAASMYAAIYEEAFAMRHADRPKVSLVMPAFNMKDYIGDAIRSVFAQTLTDWELVIVDDGSTDGTRGVAVQIADGDPRVRIMAKENGGVSLARNFGIEASMGRYVIQLDADDQLPPGALQALSSELDANRTIHGAYGNVLFVNEDGRTPTEYRVQGETPGHSGWPPEFRFDWQLRPPSDETGDRPPNLVPYACMVRREALEAVGMYRTRLQTAEDPDLWCRLASYGFRLRRVTNADCLIYRNREGSLSRTTPPVDWSLWYPWARNPALAPAGADTEQQLPVLSLDPPLIAVVIPVGPGHARYLMDAIDSVEAQTLRQFEVIVVADLAEEEWLPPLPSWVRLYRTEKRGSGPAHARNLGIAHARARLYLPLDADDMLQSDALAALYAAHVESDGAIIYCDWWEDPHAPGEYQIWETKEWHPPDLIGNGSIHSVTALTPVSVWQRLGGYDETLSGWEDWAFQIACAAECICSQRLALPLFLYRKHTGSRREENTANFDQSAADIRAKFGQYWTGGKIMGGCAGCQKRAAQSPPQQAQQIAEGMTLLRFVGSRSGSVPWKGKATGAIYFFGSGEEKYVANADLEATPAFQTPNFVRVQAGGMPNVDTNAPTISTPQPQAAAVAAMPSAASRVFERELPMLDTNDPALRYEPPPSTMPPPMPPPDLPPAETTAADPPAMMPPNTATPNPNSGPPPGFAGFDAAKTEEPQGGDAAAFDQLGSAGAGAIEQAVEGELQDEVVERPGKAPSARKTAKRSH